MTRPLTLAGGARCIRAYTHHAAASMAAASSVSPLLSSSLREALLGPHRGILPFRWQLRHQQRANLAPVPPRHSHVTMSTQHPSWPSATSHTQSHPALRLAKAKTALGFWFCIHQLGHMAKAKGWFSKSLQHFINRNLCFVSQQIHKTCPANRKLKRGL